MITNGERKQRKWTTEGRQRSGIEGLRCIVTIGYLFLNFNRYRVLLSSKIHSQYFKGLQSLWSLTNIIEMILPC